MGGERFVQQSGSFCFCETKLGYGGERIETWGQCQRANVRGKRSEENKIEYGRMCEKNVV